MIWRIRVAALLVTLALVGCAPAATTPSQVPNAPQQQDDSGRYTY
jgi:hypothetical protein